MPPFPVPDVLVLAGGGVLGEAWMTGVLAGIEDGSEVDLRRVEAFVGTSAGSIVAARLASGRAPRRPEDAPGEAAPEAGDDGRARGSAVRAALRAAGAVAWAGTAPAGRDTQVLCLDTIAGLDPRTRRMAALRGAFRVAAQLETQLLRRRGARVRHVGPDAAAAEAIGPNLMDGHAAERVLAAGYRQGRALAAAGGE
jgi:hypothetical protein